MSYMRGPSYVWGDSTRLHVRVDDGYDGWDDTSWAGGRRQSQGADSAPHDGASGVGIRQEIADAYVVMRLAELVCEQRIRAVVESAVTSFVGTWRMRPSGVPGDLTKQVITVEPAPDGAKVTADIDYGKGTGVAYSYITKFDGTEAPVYSSGKVVVTIRVRKTGPNV